MKKTLEFIYSLINYVIFLGTFVYAFGFIGNILVPKSIDTGIETATVNALIVNSLLLGLFAIQHSVMARPGFKKMWIKIIPKTIERSTYVLATNICLILMYWQWIPLKGIMWDVSGSTVLNIIMWSLYGLGWGIVFFQLF